MKKKYVAIILFCLLALMPTASAKDFYGYTDERPLIIACDWDFRPFEFLDSHGQPAGYNIEVLGMILKRLEIPHRFVMSEWSEAARSFDTREADLIHAMPMHYRNRPFIATKKYVNYYSLRAARNVSTPKFPGIHKLDSTATLLLKRDDYAALMVEAMDSVPFTVKYNTPKDGLTSARITKNAYFMWGAEPLARKIKELAIDSLMVDEVGIPAGELHIIGYDKDVVDIIDDEYTRLEQEGALQAVHDRWFHPEQQHDDASPVTLFVLMGMAVALFVVVLLSGLIRLRVKAAVRRSSDMSSMMRQALGMGDYHVLQYDLKTLRVVNRYGDLLPEEGISHDELIDRIQADEREDFREGISRLVRGECDELSFRKRWNKGTDEHPDWGEYDGTAILERENGQPRYIFHAFKDITRQVQQEIHDQEMANFYMKAFETNLVAISFYDADGYFIDANPKMRELCQLDGPAGRFYRETCLFDIPDSKAFFDQGVHNEFHMCQRLLIPELSLDKYVETRIKSIVDDEGNVVYFVVSSRDVTAERDMYMKQREHDRLLFEAHDRINHYESQLHYLLVESNMYVWRFHMDQHNIDFSRSLKDVDFSLNIDEYFSLIGEEHRKQADEIMHNALMKGLPFQAIHEFVHTPVSKKHAWYSIGGIPIKGADGRVNEYFGMARDITDIMSIQQKLRKETVRAEDSGRLKAAFLANMTHEIRTPLNAIVGFSDVLQMVDAGDERMEMIRIIRSNCDMLLRLINDILEASSMGQSLLIQPEDIDVPRVFDDICITLAQRVENVPFIKDNPLKTYPARLDKGRLQQMLTNFTTNAVKYTHEGHIKVGWRPEERNGQEGLYFYCEDTGAGIPKDKQSAVFERFVKLNDFVQGTGLGLSICKAIIDRSGGEIGVTSDGEDCGSTFWFWVPRH